MKKIIFLLLVFAFTTLYSCSNEDNYLDGTTWIATTDGEMFTLEFHKNTVQSIYQYDDNGDGVFGQNEEKEESVFNYTLDGNVVTIGEGKDKDTATISGDKLIAGTDDDAIIYYKK